MYVDNIENAYDDLTEENNLIELLDKYKAELSEKSVTIPGTLNKIFENHRFGISNNTLPGTVDKNNRV